MGRKIPETLSEEEIIKLLESIKKPKYKLSIALGFYQGMRVSEIVNLKPENVDKGQKLIRIKQAKGKKDRNIPIAPQVMKGLKHLPIGRSVRTLERIFKDKCKSLFDKDLHFHTLRHSGASYYLNKKKWDLRSVQVFLGHSKIATTEIYTHVSPQDLLERMWEK